MAEEKGVNVPETSPEVMGLLGSLATIALGAGLLLDDYKDFGKDGFERDPPMPHHWLWGVLLLSSGVTGVCASGLMMLRKSSTKTLKK